MIKYEVKKGVEVFLFFVGIIIVIILAIVLVSVLALVIV